MSTKNILSILFLSLLCLVACVPALPSTEALTPTQAPTTQKPTQPALPTETRLPPNTLAPSAIPPTPTKPTLTPSPSPAASGTLAIEIVYSGQWYRETFNYQPDAPNIRHVVLVMPADSIIQLAGAGWAFTNLKFTPSPEPLAMQEVAVEFIPILDFMYDAPGGIASIELAPGKYNVAVAFIAAALPPPGDDAILWPGVTGGGASNEFQEVIIAAGETTPLSVELTDANGWGYVGMLALR
jgi:hypothetical protein